MHDTWHHRSFRCRIACQLICHDLPGSASLTLQQLAEKPDGSRLIPARLYQNVQHITFLVHSSPQDLKSTIDPQIHFVQMPRITPASASPAQAPGVLLSKLVAPGTNALIADDHTTVSHHLLNVPIAEATAEVQPDALADDVNGETMARVATVSSHASLHHTEVYLTTPFNLLIDKETFFIPTNMG